MPQALPDFLEAHLSTGENQILPTLQPNWLLDSFQTKKWRIKIPGQSRLINGKWHRVHVLHWHFRLPGGCLADPKWHKLLEHCKLMTIAHLECTQSHSSSIHHLKFFQRKLLWLAEHLVIHYPVEVAFEGLAILDNQKMTQFLADYREGSVSGTGSWLTRWDQFIRNKASQENLRVDVDRWANALPIPQRILIDTLQRPVVTIDPDNLPAMPDTDLSVDELVFFRRWLAMQAWLNERGCIPLSRVAKAIDIDIVRLNNDVDLRYYLRLFETCTDYRFQEFPQYSHREYLGQQHRSIAQLVAMGGVGSQNDVFRLFSCIRDYSPYIDGLEGSHLPVLDMGRLPPELSHKQCQRTPTIPLDTALLLFDRLIEWALHITQPLLRYYQLILGEVINKQGQPKRYSPKKPQTKQCNRQLCPWEKAFNVFPPPAALNALRLWRVAPTLFDFKGGADTNTNESGVVCQLRQNGFTLCDAIYVNTAVLVALTAIFTLRRHHEITNLRRDCLVQCQGRSYLDFNLEKFIIDGIRAPILRPMPGFLYAALSAQQAFAAALTQMGRLTQQNGEYLFIIPSRVDSRLFDSPMVAASLDLFCDWIEVPLDAQGRRWYLRLHECRRFGAMSFFHHSGMAVSLPALSWFMGHNNIKHTWHYIREELTGKEITQVEVALTHAALLSNQAGGSGQGLAFLTKILLKHFGCARLDLIAPDELDAYLEMLHETGIFYVTPHRIVTSDGRRHVILLEINEGNITCRD